MPGDICAATAAVPLHLNARKNAFTLGKTPGETPDIAVIFQNWKKSKNLNYNQMPLYCCTGNMLHGAPLALHRLKKPPARKGELPLYCYAGDALQCTHIPSLAKEPSSVKWGIAHASLHRLVAPPPFGGEETPSSVQRALPLYCCTGDVLQGTPTPEKHTLQSVRTLTPTPTSMPTPTPTPRLKVKPNNK
jgi:hypothetical protein